MGVVVSFRIDEELKRRMEQLDHINWSAVVRRAIEEVVEAEMARLRSSRDRQRMERALHDIGSLRRRVEGWSSVEEIRRWREARR